MRSGVSEAFGQFGYRLDCPVVIEQPASAPASDHVPERAKRRLVSARRRLWAAVWRKWAITPSSGGCPLMSAQNVATFSMSLFASLPKARPVANSVRAVQRRGVQHSAQTAEA